MNLPKIDLSEAVAALLARGEPLTAGQLATATGKSASSISLAIKALGDRVHRMGAARSTRYALKKDILGLSAQQKLRWLGNNGTGFAAAQITYLVGDWLHVVCQANNGRTREWLTQHQLPWFLSTLKPQGYLGRKLARWLPQLPSDPAQWSLAQLLFSLQHISDPIGAVDMLSPTARPAHPRITSLSERDAAFDALANEDTAQLPVGSSAAGEQPKFVASVLGQSCIVKFTPPHGTPFGQRWQALLKLEKLALDILQSHAIPSAHSEIVRTQKRAYLQSARFDRDAAGSACHIVAIAALHDEFVQGNWTNWVASSEALAKQGLIVQQELAQIASIHAFGHYIGNTDMHSGNLSFFVDDVITPKIRLAPVYDMLPMMWKPDPYTGLSDSPVRAQLMPAGFAQEQAQAREWAIEFWEQAAALDIGADLQSASVESARRIKTNFADV
jgi:DNA-binding transcriptional ArsR family regulator